MSFNQDKFWISEEGYNESEELLQSSSNEFFNLPILNDVASEDENTSTKTPSSRRDFLRYLGFSVGAATIAASCDTPVRRAIPYVKKPDSIVPGVATYYASSYTCSGDFCPVLVKTREGRPIKIEGNLLSPLTEGGTTARVQASVLELYDTSRFKEPAKLEGGELKDGSWATIDSDIKSKLSAGSNIRIVSHSIISPSGKSAIAKFKEKYPNTEHLSYDPYSSSALVAVHEQMTGERGVPFYDFSKADSIVTIGADFLGTWVAPAIFSKQFGKNRKVVDPKHPNLNYLLAVESNMSLTGSNADDRIQIRPSEKGAFIAALHNSLAAMKGVSGVGNAGVSAEIKTEAAKAADVLLKSKSTLVVSDSNNQTEQELIAAINDMLGNYGTTIANKTLYTRQGKDAELAKLVSDMNSGSVDAVIFVDEANPVYDTPYGSRLNDALSKVSLKVSMAYAPNETAALCDYICPVNHYLESWSDVNPTSDYFGLVQPTIPRLFNTRSYQESLLSLADVKLDSGLVGYLKSEWQQIFAQQSRFATFQAFWDATLHDGLTIINTAELAYAPVSLSGKSISKPSSSELEVRFFEPVGVGSGQFANNPWLQEMPDPITRVVWDNNVQIPIKWEDGGKNFKVYGGFKKDGQYANISMGDKTEMLPIVKQFGQANNSVAIALGYGRTVCGSGGINVGKSFTSWLPVDSDGNVQYYCTDVNLNDAKKKDKEFASVQHHHTLGITGEVKGGKIENVDEKTAMTINAGNLTNFQGGLTDRTILRQSNLDDLSNSIAHLKHERDHIHHLNESGIYAGHDEDYKNGHHWGLAIDLTACTGCGACQVACIAENNVPVVGKKEVFRHHEMTWLRLDRYYYGDANNPNVFYQPMMCQQCDNAPCENVCPVQATTHSSEGLNIMTYNRCVGTRYCANNCPYKVRRFNWLDYTTADTFFGNQNYPLKQEGDAYYTSNLVRMVLNPDVTVRSRGVIEKCSMCVQRIQEGKLLARRENRPLRDGDIKVACQTACPTGGIIFGDLNDKDSKLNERWHSELNYFALEEVNVKPSVGYQMKVTNKKLTKLEVFHGRPSQGHDAGHEGHDDHSDNHHDS